MPPLRSRAKRSRSLSENWEGSRAWGWRGADKAREGGDVLHIVDDEQRSMRPQPPCALRVPAAHGHLRCCRASTMYTNIACGPAPSMWCYVKPLCFRDQQTSCFGSWVFLLPNLVAGSRPREASLEGLALTSLPDAIHWPQEENPAHVICIATFPSAVTDRLRVFGCALPRNNLLSVPIKNRTTQYLIRP
jgi:hypothetical protein